MLEKQSYQPIMMYNLTKHSKEHVNYCANVTHMKKVYNSLLNDFGWPIAYIGLHWAAWVKPTLVCSLHQQ